MHYRASEETGHIPVDSGAVHTMYNERCFAMSEITTSHRGEKIQVSIKNGLELLPK